MRIFGAVLERGENFYTDLSRVLRGIGGIPAGYHWLVTDFEYNIDIPSLERDYLWWSSEELSRFQKQYDPQWIWGILCGFPPGVSLEEVLRSPLPRCTEEGDAEMYFNNPISMQHPLSEIEIFAYDSSAVFLLSRRKEIVQRFREAFPLSEDLEAWNAKF